MATLIKQVAEKFNASPISEYSIFFSSGEDDYCLTDGTLYATCDGQFMPNSKKVKRINQVVKFISDRG